MRFCIRWLPKAQVWQVWSNSEEREVERFRHLADAGWWVQSQYQDQQVVS